MEYILNSQPIVDPIMVADSCLFCQKVGTRYFDEMSSMSAVPEAQATYKVFANLCALSETEVRLSEISEGQRPAKPLVAWLILEL